MGAGVWETKHTNNSPGKAFYTYADASCINKKGCRYILPCYKTSGPFFKGDLVRLYGESFTL